MASGNGARIVPPAVPMTITQIAVVVADMESRAALLTRSTSAGGRGACSTSKPPLLHDTVVRGSRASSA